MGDVIPLFQNGRVRDAAGRTPNARMLDRLGPCTFEHPERSSWVFVFETNVPASWFKQNARFVYRFEDGTMFTAEIGIIESFDGKVSIICEFPEGTKRFRQLGDTSHVPTEPGMYLLTSTDEWHPLPLAA